MGENNGRKTRRAMVDGLLLAKLYKDGFIQQDDDGVYHLDLSSNIETRYGSDPEVAKDIREVITRVSVGLRRSGHTVKAKYVALVKPEDQHG